jgi:hypothetical protein
MRSIIPHIAAAVALGLGACGPDDFGAAPPEAGEGAAGLVEPLEEDPNVELQGDPAYKGLENGVVSGNAPEAE